MRKGRFAGLSGGGEASDAGRRWTERLGLRRERSGSAASDADAVHSERASRLVVHSKTVRL